MFWWLAIIVLLLASSWLVVPLLAPSAERRLPWLALSLILALPALGLALYQQLGTPQALTMPSTAQPESLGDMINLLETRLQQSGGSADEWLLLGRAYREMGRHGKAAKALEQVNQISPDNPIVLAELAESLIFSSPPGNFPARATTLLQRALVIDPDSQRALWLAGLSAMQNHQAELANKHWQHLLTLLEPNSAVAASVQAQLDKLNGAAQNPPAGALIEANLVLDTTLADLPPGPLTVFLIARDPQQPLPPIAVHKYTLDQFPATLQLNDSDSMLQQRRLTQFTQVEVTARLSRSGQPRRQAGDIESLPVTVAIKEKTASVVNLTLSHSVTKGNER